MEKKVFTVKGASDANIFVREWMPKEEPKASLMLIHGLGEHSGRYDDFARYMTKLGFVVWAHDHRQHGNSVGHDGIGIFGKEDSWKSMLTDTEVIYNELKATYTTLPCILLGHSMGSLLLRCFLQGHRPSVAAAVIMGTPVTPYVKSKVGTISCRLIRRFTGKRRTPLLHNLAVGGFNKMINGESSVSDWTTHDRFIIEKNKADPLFGYVYSAGFYLALSRGSILANRSSQMKKLPHIPLLFISGDEDPCGKKGLGVVKLSKKYKRYNIDNELILMSGMRHEVLNEIDRRLTFQLLSDWMVKQI